MTKPRVGRHARPVHDSAKIARAPGVRVATAEGRRVLQHAGNGRAFALDAIGGRIWDLIEQPRVLGEIVDELAKHFAVTPDVCRNDVRTFVDHLVTAGLARLGDETAPMAHEAADAVALAPATLERIAALCDWLQGDLSVFSPEDTARQPELLAEAHTAILGAAARLGAIEAKFQAARADHIAAQWQSIRDRFGERDLKINLGSGRTPLPGWVNLDRRAADARVDFRWRFPLADACARQVYSSHVLEHLDYPADALHFLRECLRVLQPGAVLRLVVPDIGRMTTEYVAEERGFFTHYAEIRSADTQRTPLEQLLSYAGARRTALQPFAGHRFGYDFETLKRLLTTAGFSNVTRCQFMGSEHPELRVDAASQVAGLNYQGRSYSLFVEALRPQPSAS
ncbi:MAG TPA: PqqD family peptide modification chaperone [Opitutaceae bacterium]